MEKAEYKPNFVDFHALLLEMYENLMMTKHDREILLWGERFKSLARTMECLKNAGVFSPVCVILLQADVVDVAQRVHGKIKKNHLKEGQGVLTFAMANLQSSLVCR